MTTPSLCINCGKRSLKPLCGKCVSKASSLISDNKKKYHVTCIVCGKKTKTMKEELANDKFVCPTCR